MKVLQLCKKFPYPLKDGESIATTYLAKALNELGCDVTLLAMNTSKHRADLDALPPDFDHYTAIHAVEVDNRLHPKDALVNLLFSSESYHVNRFDNADFAQKLIELLEAEDYDIVHLETLFLTPYVPLIRQHSRARVVMRSHNVEHSIWERVAVNSHPLKRWYLQQITPRLRNYEIQHLNDYDLFCGITQRDLDIFEQLGLTKTAVVAPIGLDCRDYEPDESAFSRPVSLSFIGSLDWMPNTEGLQWFIDEVWIPLVQPEFPHLEFHIAGRNTPTRLLKMKVPGITVHGEVPSARAFLNNYPITIAPLLSGGGMRAKILEGMALGRVVISSSVGMEGIEATPGREALIANTPHEWIEAIRWCCAPSAPLRETGRKAAAFCRDRYDNRQVASRLLEAYRSVGEPELTPV